MQIHGPSLCPNYRRWKEEDLKDVVMIRIQQMLSWVKGRMDSKTSERRLESREKRESCYTLLPDAQVGVIVGEINAGSFGFVGAASEFDELISGFRVEDANERSS